VLLVHFGMNFSNRLLVLAGALFVFVVDLPHARRMDQELCKAAVNWCHVILHWQPLTAVKVMSAILVPTTGTANKRLSSWGRSTGTNIGRFFFPHLLSTM
jgi:hypothetical protein